MPDVVAFSVDRSRVAEGVFEDPEEMRRDFITASHCCFDCSTFEVSAHSLDSGENFMDFQSGLAVAGFFRGWRISARDVVGGIVPF